MGAGVRDRATHGVERGAPVSTLDGTARPARLVSIGLPSPGAGLFSDLGGLPFGHRWHALVVAGWNGQSVARRRSFCLGYGGFWGGAFGFLLLRRYTPCA